MGDLSSSLTARIAASTGGEERGGADRRALRAVKQVVVVRETHTTPAPDLDLTEKEERHQLDERA